jgi:hypothetical protein
MDVNAWFLAAFVVMWALGPATQVLQLIAPKLHMRLGLMEKASAEPRFEWFRLAERGMAFADLTFFIAAILFVVLVIAGDETAILFGLYTCACYVYFGTSYIAQFILLSRKNLHPASKKETGVYFVYMGLFIAFGLYGLVYLWGVAQG